MHQHTIRTGCAAVCARIPAKKEGMLSCRAHLQFRDEAEATGKLVSARHPVARMVSDVGMRIAAVAQEDVDGHPIEHMKVQALIMMRSLRTSLEPEWSVQSGCK